MDEQKNVEVAEVVVEASVTSTAGSSVSEETEQDEGPSECTEAYDVSVQPVTIIGSSTLPMSSERHGESSNINLVEEAQNFTIGPVTESEIVVTSENILETTWAQTGPNRSKIPSIGVCQVCSDKGTGFHYSVFSCEGCKGFFKRSVQRNLVYSCKEDQNCVINKYTRNNCQYCRYQKCMEMGMKKEAVREDRTPGGKHRHKRLRPEEVSVPSTTEDAMRNMTTVIVPSEPVDKDLVEALVEAQPDYVPVADKPIQDSASVDINDIMQYGYMELRYIIDWARKVPGFSDLLLEDQMALLKASFMELNVLRLAYRSMDWPGSVKFAQGVILSSENAVSIGWGSDLINNTLDFGARLNDIAMDRVEFCILNSIVLTYPDASGVVDKAAVTTLQGNLLDCLRKYTVSTYPTEPRRYGKILLRLPCLRSISSKAAERFLTMSLDSTIKMNALVVEMMS